MPNKEDVINIIRQADSAIEISPTDVTEETQLVGELGLDSIHLVRMVVAIETTYGVVIPDADLDFSQFETVGKLADYIDRLTKQR